ncbi:hypothetical protein OS187_05895 [Xanthomonadaceae bacterium JHOS43]|nr:hypothetical protein [Xanthomonadaceae bacterium JHOS43]MCX7562488.1 hypothetical protein [Xanthomonadaceae bacterium XH05]
MSPISVPFLKPLRRLSLVTACALACAWSVQAQPGAVLAGADTDTQVLPVWNTSSGRVEALLLLSPDADENGPLDRLFPRESALPGMGLNMTLDGGSRLSGTLQPEANTGLALLCNQGIHVAMTLGPLGQQCLLAQVGGQGDILLPASRDLGVALDAKWRSASGGLDLSFGLSWLDTPLRGSDPLPLPGLGAMPPYVSILPSLQPAVLGDLSLREVHWKGSLALGAQRWLSLGGSVGTQELAFLSGVAQRWDTTTITFGLGYRGFTGRLTGRLIELPQGQGNFSGLDLGVTWRTPWQGELSFGAQNLLDKTPDTSQWPLRDLPAIEVPGGRTPYVRYKQDL